MYNLCSSFFLLILKKLIRNLAYGAPSSLTECPSGVNRVVANASMLTGERIPTWGHRVGVVRKEELIIQDLVVKRGKFWVTMTNLNLTPLCPLFALLNWTFINPFKTSYESTMVRYSKSYIGNCIETDCGKTECILQWYRKCLPPNQIETISSQSIEGQ